MVRARLAIVLGAVLLSVQAHAGWKVVFDPWTTGAVTANAASQELIESQHNTRLDSINSKQQKIMQYTATMHVLQVKQDVTEGDALAIVFRQQGISFLCF